LGVNNCFGSADQDKSRNGHNGGKIQDINVLEVLITEAFPAENRVKIYIGR
jgi:hypothetical protein